MQFPRFCGNPSQACVEDAAQYEGWLKRNRGINACYESHNPMRGDLSAIFVERIPFDFDAKKEEKPEHALADALSFRDWSRANAVPYLIRFSGKGMHGYSVFNGLWTQNNPAYKRFLEAYQNHVISEAKLRTADSKIIGDVRRIMRIPNTPYVTESKDENGAKVKISNGLFCVDVPDEILNRGDLEEVKSWAAQERPLIEPRGKETFPEALTRLKVKAKPRDTSVRTPTIEYRIHTPDFVKAVLPRPCIHSNLMTNNPPHFVRFEAAATLTNANYDIEWLLGFFAQVAEAARWVDRGDMSETRRQVWHIYRNPGYKQHSCERIREKGYCVGASGCSLFEDVFPNG